MDVIEELDIFPAFVSATNIIPDLFVEYLPVNMRIYNIWAEFSLDMMFPHIMGKPWTPYNYVGVCGDTRVKCYNGVIIAAIYTRERITYRIYYENGSYEGTNTNDIKFTTDPNNLFIDQYASSIYTKIGDYNVLRGLPIKVNYNQSIEVVENHMLDKKYYRSDGSVVEGLYTGVIYEKMPEGCEDYNALSNDIISIKTINNPAVNDFSWATLEPNTIPENDIKFQ